MQGTRGAKEKGGGGLQIARVTGCLTRITVSAPDGCGVCRLYTTAWGYRRDPHTVEVSYYEHSLKLLLDIPGNS